jgi:predicted RNA binding protein YcfA (HicA-like mRNA interferase family)
MISLFMPRKLRQLLRELEKAGFLNRGGKGSHRNYMHSKCPYPVVISGRLGADAKPYQEKAIKFALKEIKR